MMFLIGIETMSSKDIKQSAKQLHCTILESIMAVLKSYVIHVQINLWGRDFLQQINKRDLYVFVLKDCFYTILIHPDDKVHFYFSLPSLIHNEPQLQYQWIVKP